MADRTDSPAELEREVALRRQRLERDVQELQARLSPGQLVDEGMAYLRRSQGADFFRNLGTAVRDRPLPVSLVGIGLAWLAASGAGPNGRARERSTESDGPSLTSRAWEAGRAIARKAGETQADYTDRVMQARAQVLGLTQQAGETVDSYRERVEQGMYAARDSVRAVRDRVASAASDGYERVSGAASEGYARAQDYTSRATDGAGRAIGSIGQSSSNLAHTVGENPILLGAVGMVAGALLGALIPRSRTEEEMLRPIADSAAGTVRDLASQAMDQGERVARAAMEAGKEATRAATKGAEEVAEKLSPGQGERGKEGEREARPAPTPERTGGQVSPLRREPDRVTAGPTSPANRSPRPTAIPERERERQAAGSTPLPGTDRTGDGGTSPMVG